MRDLFETGSLPYARRYDSSREAASYMEGKRANTQKGKLFRYLIERGDDGATDEQMSQDTGIALNSVHPRRKELQRDLKLIRERLTDDGEFYYRQTDSGQKAIVWVVSELGYTLWEGRDE